MKEIVLITGASSGVGAGCYKYFSDSGLAVVGVDKDGKSDVNFDVSCRDDVVAYFEGLRRKGIKIKTIINNAAIQIEKNIILTEEDEWERVMNTNLKSVYLMTKHGFDLMNRGSSIINISSVHAKCTSKGMATYVASKGALSALTRAMSLELAEFGIRVNSILPGAVDTPMLRKGLARNSSYDESLEKLLKATPLNRLGTPEDVAKLAFFLSDENMSSFITGQEFICDGGVTARLASE